MKRASWLVSLASEASGSYTMLDYARDVQATASQLPTSIWFLRTLLIVALVVNMVVELGAGNHS